MSHSHTDLKAIKTKLRSLQQDRRVTHPTSPPPEPATQRDPVPSPVWDDAPGIGDSDGLAAESGVADPETMLLALRQRSRSTLTATPATAMPPAYPAPRSPLISSGLSNPLPGSPLGAAPTSARTSAWMADQQRQQERQQVKAVIQRLNRAAQDQETALIELYQLLQLVSPDVAQEWDSLGWHEAALTLPWILQTADGEWQLTPRPVDLTPALQEAESVAQFLRDRAKLPQSTLKGRFHPLLAWFRRAQASRRAEGGDAAARSAGASAWPDLGLVDVAIWVAGAALVRFGFTALVASVAMPLPIALGLALAGAAVVLYVGATQSASGLAFGYRLVLIVIGLILGGQIA